MGVDESQARHDDVDRHDEDGHREHLRDQEDHHQLAPTGEVEPGQRVAGRGRHEDADDHRERRHDHRVEEPGREVRLGQHVLVVRQRRFLDQAQFAALHPHAGLERRQHHPRDREHRDQRRDDQRGVQQDRRQRAAPPATPHSRDRRCGTGAAPPTGPATVTISLSLRTSLRRSAIIHRRGPGRSLALVAHVTTPRLACAAPAGRTARRRAGSTGSARRTSRRRE